MFSLLSRSKNMPRSLSDLSADCLTGPEILDMVHRTHAVIAFTPSGNILDANANFLAALGYEHDEIMGQHHRIFLSQEDIASEEYAHFWKRLSRGDVFSGEFKRIGKNGNPIWISATYAPVRNAQGEVVEVVKIASDITARKEAVDAIVEALDRLKEGDLSHRISLDHESEFNVVAQSFNESMMAFASAFTSLKGNTTLVEEAAKDMRRMADDQLHSQEDRARDFKVVSDHIRHVASLVADMKTASGAIDEASVAASEVMSEALRNMQVASGTAQRLEERAKDMSQANKLINDISFQTNLLALNAGVEAARAGEAGAGFSVVATEIRNLAQHAASASKDIDGLISEIGASVQAMVSTIGGAEAGLNGVDETFATIKSSLSEINQVSVQQDEQMSEIETEIAGFERQIDGESRIMQNVAEMSQKLENACEDMAASMATYTFRSAPSGMAGRAPALLRAI